MGKDDELEVTRHWAGRRYRRRLSRGLVTVAEAAELLRVTPRTVWNLVARHQLHPRRRGSRVWFLLSEVKFRSSVWHERR
jgi:excisionase family DNA binding protein